MRSVLSFLFGGPASVAAAEPSSLSSFHSYARWQLYFNEAKESPQLMVIDFSSTWCSPCKFFEPAIKAMASRFTDVQFVKIDVVELHDVAKEFNVQAVPTFVLVKKGKELDRVVGAEKDELEKKIEKHRDFQAAA